MIRGLQFRIFVAEREERAENLFDSQLDGVPL
jgi:hypothetical protein